MTEGGQENLRECFEDFFESALCGYLIVDTSGTILRANKRLAAWVSLGVDELQGMRFNTLLSMGSRMFFETHLSPLLRMQGAFEEVAVELRRADGTRIRVLLNGYEKRDAEGKPLFVRLTAYRATERLAYEHNLRESKVAVERELSEEKELSELREQFIAVLGHDLRNPLGAVLMGASLLQNKPLDDNGRMLLKIIKESAGRMEELIRNVMDFARVRMGTGLSLDRNSVHLEPVLTAVINELRTSHAHVVIESEMVLPGPVYCDASRLCQILSNLLANAVTHGSTSHPVHVRATANDEAFELSVSNAGRPIPETIIPTLFQPFTRQKVVPGDGGLGLGLYIAAEVAKAHEGTLGVESSEERTCFTFRMPISDPGSACDG